MFPFLLYGDWGLAALRIVLGVILLAHGWPKLEDLKKTSENFAGMGFKPGSLWATVAAIVEFFGGLALILGIWTEIPAFFVVCEFVVIMIWRLARKQPLVGGYELDLLILAGAVVLLTQGAGPVSFDRYLYGSF
jgi:putative oxidoreductase